MVKIQQLSDDVIRLRFILFALKDKLKSGYIVCPLTLFPCGMHLLILSLKPLPIN